MTYNVFVGESLPSLGLFVRENGVLVSLASGYTFELKVASLETGAVLIHKTTGITGQAGSGYPPLGTPNVVVAWAATGELHDLTPGTYRAQLFTTAGDSRVRIDEFLIAARLAL